MLPRKRVFKTKSLYPRRTIYIHKGHFRLFKHRTERERLFRRFNFYVAPRAPAKKSWTPTKSVSTKKPKPFNDLSAVRDKWQKSWSDKKKTWTNDTVFPTKSEADALEREKKKGFKKDLKKEFKKKLDGRFGANQSIFRTYPTNLGKAKRLGPHNVIIIKPTMEFMKAIKTEQGSWTRGWMSSAVKSSIDILRAKLLEHAEMIINIYVPKETGDLRASMLKELERRRRVGYRLEMRVGTPMMGSKSMTYAGPVNKMSEEQIQHHGNKKGRVTRRLLFDPKAQKGWYELIRMKLNNHLVDRLLPAFYRNLMQDAIEKKGIKVQRHKIQTRSVTKSVVGYRNFTNQEILDGWYINWKGKVKYISTPKVGPRTVVRTETGKQKVTSEDYMNYIKEKRSSFPQRLRQAAERAKKSKPLKAQYKKGDVMKWFTIEIPFKK